VCSADGRTIGTVLRPSVICDVCIVVKWCVLEQKLLLRAYNESYYQESVGTKMNDLDLSLYVVLRTCQPLRHISYISETIADRGLILKDHRGR